MKIYTIIAWMCRVAAAVILLQTLCFKVTAAPESVYIFTKVGLEPWGRIGSGIAELIAAILFLIPATTWWCAGLSFAVMAGAIFSHLTVLGIVVMDDGGLLFGLALAVAGSREKNVRCSYAWPTNGFTSCSKGSPIRIPTERL